jgi:hypothetical protein
LVDFSNKFVYAADDGSHMEQPCVVVERSKAALRTKRNIPKCALLAELGWEPISALLDRQKGLFFPLGFPNYHTTG